MPRILATADVGSNTAHLLVAATDGRLVMRVDNLNEWIPLGEAVARQGEIPKEMIESLILALREFKRLATAQEADGLYVFATEAVRAAGNHQEALRKIAKETGVKVEIISPQREAELSLGGVRLDSAHLDLDMLFEVGGGSAQIARLDGAKLTEAWSLPLGTGRIIAESGMRQPCPEPALRAAREYIQRTLEDSPVGEGAAVAVASGGVGRGLWRALHPDGEKRLRLEEMDYLVGACVRLPVDRISARFGVRRSGRDVSTGRSVYSAPC